MRYTRYDIKGKNKVNFAWWLILIVVFGIILGISGYKILVKSSLIDFAKNNNAIKDGEEEYKINIIQCGVYKNKENADMQVKTLQKDSYNIPFIIEDGDKFKVMSGMCEESMIEERVKEMNNNNITNFVINIKMNSSKNEDTLKMQVIQGYVQIMQKFQQDSDVKAINSDKFKEWAQDILKEYNGNDEDIKVIKEKVDSLPNEYTRDNASEDSAFIYNILIKYKTN